MNAIKGKVGSGNADKGKEFFEKAFGRNEAEFFKIIEMPETMILYRFFFEWLGDEKNYPVSTNAWWQCWQETFEILNETKKAELKEIIHQNKFASLQTENYNPNFVELLNFYTNYRDDIITSCINSNKNTINTRHEY